MIYADYQYYARTFYGDVVPEDDYPKCATRASDFIDRITMNRAQSYVTLHPEDESVKKACCAGAEQYYLLSNATAVAASAGGEIASETVGSHSVSYRSSAETKAAIEAEMLKAITAYLAVTGLLYRGISNVHASHCYADYS